jgi:hypothetical protein
MQLVCAFAVVGFFWNSERANRLTTRILPAIGGAGLALCLIGIIANYSALTGSDNPIVNSLPLVLIPVVIGALFYARWMKSAQPAKYAVLARGEIRPLRERLAPRVRLRAPLLHRRGRARGPHHGAGVAGGGRSVRRL